MSSMSRIRELLQQGDRAAAIAALRRLANGGAADPAATSSDPDSVGTPSSRAVWEDALRRLEQRGDLDRTMSDQQFAALVRATVADCVREAIDADSRRLRQSGSAAPATAAMSAHPRSSAIGGASPGHGRSAGGAASPSLGGLVGNASVRPALGGKKRCIAGDVDCDGVVDANDLGALLGAWGSANPAADFNGDGVVGADDLSVLLANWGAGQS